MKNIVRLLLALAVLLAMVIPSLADTIKLKDGNVIRGQIVGFKDGQFTVLIGSGAKGRRSRTTIYVEDVDSIEFDSANGNANASTSNDDTTGPANNSSMPTTQPSQPSRQSPPPETSTQPISNQSAAPTFFTVKVTVRGDNTNNGWTNTGLVVRRGQRLKVTASGRVSLRKDSTGHEVWTTPNGIATIRDDGKLLRTEATGALIGVIGDDNDDFILVGGRHEFVAQRDGILFLGVNEGDLTDNTGTFDVAIEAETGSGAPRSQ